MNASQVLVIRSRTIRGLRRWFPAAVLFAAASAVLPATAGIADAATPHHHEGARGAALYVATTGTDTGSCRSLASPCATLGYALSQARPRDQIVLEPGTYVESDDPTGTANVVTPDLRGLTIRSDQAMGGAAGNTVIDATGEPNGILVEASHASVIGLTVENANLEGILVEPPMSSWPSAPTSPAARIFHVTIANNVVEHNDMAYDTSATNPNLACTSSPTDTDDCGEAIHLLGASFSKVIGNNVIDNVGGILVSDGGLPTGPTSPPTSVGPAAHNLIAYNVVSDNAFDCGITLPGHDPRAVATSGTNAGMPQPQLAGVYGNLVEHNVSTGNGGSGFLDATPYPGTGSYDNTFAHNAASDNGNSGFTLHSHAPLQDVNGIKLLSNSFGPNNLAGDPDAGITATTGVLFLSVAVTVRGTVVAHNTVFDDVNGIARTSNVRLHGIGHNQFFGVGTPYLVYTAP